MKLSKPPPTGVENHQNLQQIWTQQQLKSFEDYLGRHNIKDVVSTLEAIQKTAFHHDEDIDMLKLGCTLPNLTKICLHKSAAQNFYPSRGQMKSCWRKREKSLFVVLLSFLQAKQFLMKLSLKSLQTIFGFSQLYPYSVCQPMLSGLFTRWDLNLEKIVITFQQNKSGSLEKMVLSYFNRTKLHFKVKSFYATGRQKKIDCFKVDGFRSHCNTVFEAMGCFNYLCPCQKVRPSLTE